VANITKEGDVFTATFVSGKVIQSHAVLAAAGSQRKKLIVPGADQYEHKGVTYCASCDGPMFSDQDVVVVGGGNAAFESAAQLLAYAKSVTLIQRSKEYRADPVTVQKVLSHPNMKGITNTELVAVHGEAFVTGLEYKDLETGQTAILRCTGIFVEIGHTPNTAYLNGLVELTSLGTIVVEPRTQKTSCHGIWAAGDCTDGLYHQIGIASGDAIRALEDIYLELKSK
jgi:thioredoxin reductase